MDYKKNDILVIDISDIGTDGEGIGKMDGYTLFVKDALPGDKAKVKIMKAKKDYAYAHLEQIVEPSKDRIKPKCPIARQCGGCQLQHLSEEGQKHFKETRVENAIRKIGNLNNEIRPIISMENPYYYRNKIIFPVSADVNGKCIIGFYRYNSH